MEQLIRIGVDTSKRFFQVHGVDQAERPVLRKKLTRHQFGEFFRRLPPSVVAMEACGGAHHWGRELTRIGHTVKLIAPQLANVTRGKDDAADAAALCEAASRPSMRFVPIKTVDQQAALMLAGERERLVRSRTQLTTTIRGYGAEFGQIAAKGPAQIAPLLQRLQNDATVPDLARELFTEQAADYARLQARIAAVETRPPGS